MPKRSYHRLFDEHLHYLIAQGNHEAYVRLKKRYKYHSLTLCRDFLAQYCDTGISIRELLLVCDGCFLAAVRKFEPLLKSFFSYWKDMATRRIMEYMIDNAYIISFDSRKDIVSLDEDYENKHPTLDMVCEKDDDRHKKRVLFEVKNVIAKNKEVFTKLESTILSLILDGYSLGELEHGEIVSRSNLYLTFKSAVEKLQKLIKRIKINRY
jgi:hypothetical protein